MKVRKCIGDGQGSCKRCSDNGKWNRSWMCFLFEIDGLDGVYCSDCMHEIAEENDGIISFVDKKADAHHSAGA